MTVPAGAEGPGREACGAAKRQADGRCTLPAGWGTPHPGVGRCKLHGGNTGAQRAKAAVIVEDRAARGELARLGEPEPIRHPVLELLDLAAIVVQWREILRARVQVLADLHTVDELGAERERAVVVLYERALDRCERVLTSLARLDLDARRFRLEAGQAELTLAALEAAWRVLPPEQATAAREAFSVAFAALAPPSEDRDDA